MANFIQQITQSPKKLFLIDGFGALLSAVMLGLVLAQFNDFFGLSRQTFYVLALFPVLFAIYDFYCFFGLKTIRKIHFVVLAGINFAYCIISLVILIYHASSLTMWAWVYFITEIGIITALVILELRLANTLSRNK